MSEPVVKSVSEGWSLKEAIDAFIAREFVEGELVSHEWIEYHLCIPEPKSIPHAIEIRWLLMSRMDEFRAELLHEHKICLANVVGEGYRIVPPAEQARYAVQKTLSTVTRALSKGRAIIENTKTDGLDVEQRRRHTDARNKMDALQAMTSKSKRRIFDLADESAS